MDGNPRVLAVVGMVTGPEHYRIAMPFSHLHEQGHQVAWVHKDHIGRISQREWDMVVIERMGMNSVDSWLFLSEMRAAGVKIVVDLDDDFVNATPDNPACPEEEELAGMLNLVRGADLVTVSTPTLAQVMRAYNPKVQVLPNCIDPDQWQFKDKKAVRLVEGLTVGVHGGASHYSDWAMLANLFPRLVKETDATMVVCGYHPDYMRALKEELGERLQLVGWVPLEYYPAAVAQIDIGLCPLRDTTFNRSKSFIKAMESAMVGAPVVASPTVYNQLLRPGLGFLAQTEEEWVRYVVKLASKARLRRQLGENLRREVLRRYNVHDQAWRWMAAYRKAWQDTTKA